MEENRSSANGVVSSGGNDEKSADQMMKEILSEYDKKTADAQSAAESVPAADNTVSEAAAEPVGDESSDAAPINEEAAPDDESSSSDEADNANDEAAETEENDEDALENNFGRNSDDADEEYRQPKKKKKKKSRHNPGRIVFALVITTLIIAAALVIAMVVIRVAQAVTGLNREDKQIVVDIPENSSTEDIAQILVDDGIIDEPELFRLMAKLKGVDSRFTSGSHVLSPNMTFSDIMETLQENPEAEREYIDLTFPEGITLYDAAHILETNGVCSADRFIYIFNSSSFGFDFEEQVTTSSKKFYKMEGFLFPDTYSFYLDEEPEVVAKKFYRNFENRLTPDYYGRMKDLGLSLEETITLASMVQAESSNISDMKKVASVFLNRLNNSEEYPRLESDPTRKYVEDVIKPNIDIPNQEMFNAYDTYKGEGLPPGPICNPGLDAISAVLYPEDTDYYFFCADLETGEVFYAKTLEEHQENLVKAHLM